MATSTQVGGHSSGFAATRRKDLWWIYPAAVLLGLSAFIVYATWAALQGAHYFAGPYLSPFYSPVLYTDLSAAGHAPLEHAWFGRWPGWWPAWIPASPAILILIFPGIFRVTCYYYRKAYYRAFAGTPPACAVGALPRRNYRGETGLLIFQNLHRYALYFALAYIVILTYDAVTAYFYNGEFGIGVGSLVLTANVILLGSYTFGCHSLRHLVGGSSDCLACSRLRYGTWRKVSLLNRGHMTWAWLSLIWVGFSDLYVRMVSMGIWQDLNTWGV
jgi:hypothetical protein